MLDPFKYMVGKYNHTDQQLFNLPSFDKSIKVHPKIEDTNNSSYIDGFFSFLTSQVLHNHNFIHGLDYYGSFLAIKNNFTLNVCDDIDYLNNSDFFNKNKNVLFKIDDYEHLFQFQNEDTKLKPLKIEHNLSLKSNISIKSFDNEVFEDMFSDDNTIVNLEDLKGNYSELIDITNSNLTNDNENKVTLKSNSTCSSRTSYTVDGETEDPLLDPLLEKVEQNDEQNDEQNELKEESELEEENELADTNEIEDDTQWEDEESNAEDDDSFEEEVINETIPQFPV